MERCVINRLPKKETPLYEMKSPVFMNMKIKIALFSPVLGVQTPAPVFPAPRYGLHP